MPIIHGYNEAGACHSSAFFFRTRDDDMGCGNELLFWGDVSSKQDDRTTTLPQEDYNSKVWKEAANRWDQGKLKGVFVSALKERNSDLCAQTCRILSVSYRSNARMIAQDLNISCSAI